MSHCISCKCKIPNRLKHFLLITWITVLVGALFVSGFGLLTYSFNWAYILITDFWDSFHGKTWPILAMTISVLILIALILFGVSFSTDHLILFLCLSFICQFLAMILSLYFALCLTARNRNVYIAEAHKKYVSLAKDEFEHVNNCRGIKASGCVSIDMCCDNKLEDLFNLIFDSQNRWFLIFPILWIVDVTFLAPSLVCFWYMEKYVH